MAKPDKKRSTLAAEMPNVFAMIWFETRNRAEEEWMLDTALQVMW